MVLTAVLVASFGKVKHHGGKQGKCLINGTNKITNYKNTHILVFDKFKYL